MQELKPDELGRLDKLAAGGEAVIYRVPDLTLPGESGPFVYKQYRDRVADGRREAVRNGLRSLIRVRELAPSRARDVLGGRSVWPLAVVADERGATGCIMREVPPTFFRTLTLSTGRTRHRPWAWELHLQHPNDVAARGLPTLDDGDVFFLLARALRFLAEVHDLDVVIGDLSSANILISAVPGSPKECRPMFVDVDAYRRASGMSALTQAHTAGWWTPESRRHRAEWKALEAKGAPHHEVAQARARSRIQDKPSDVYKAGLLVLRTMDAGPDSGQLLKSAIGVERLRRICGSRNADVVLQSLSDDPLNRPSASAVAAAFTKG